MTPTPEQKLVIRCRGRGQAETLIPSLNRAYPIDGDACFDKVLRAIDEAEQQVWSVGGAEDD
jgi:hypothetical protein